MRAVLLPSDHHHRHCINGVCVRVCVIVCVFQASTRAERTGGRRSRQGEKTSALGSRHSEQYLAERHSVRPDPNGGDHLHRRLCGYSRAD